MKSPLPARSGSGTDPERPSLSAIVISYNSEHDLGGCLRALEADDGVDEIIVVDNRSTDRSVALARSFDEVTVLASPVNDGFAGGANRGAAAARGDNLLFLNPDVQLRPGSGSAITEALARHPGIVGPVVACGERAEVEYGAAVDLVGAARPLAEPATPFFVPGCALAVAAPVFSRLGGFDARYFLFAEDVELCWRALLAGLDVTVALGALAHHAGGGSTPGGYLREARLETTELRVALRERNTLAMVLSCAPAPLAPVLGAACAAKTIGSALVVGAMGHAALTRALLRGLLWNLTQLPATLERRRSIQCRERDRWSAFRRVRKTLFFLGVIRTHGLPRFVDDTA